MSRAKATTRPTAPLHWVSSDQFMVPAIAVAAVVGVALSWPLHQPRVGRLAAAVVLGTWLLYAIAYAVRNHRAKNESLLSIGVVGCTFAAIPAYFVMSACSVSFASRAWLALVWLLVPATLMFAYNIRLGLHQPQVAEVPASQRR